MNNLAKWLLRAVVMLLAIAGCGSKTQEIYYYPAYGDVPPKHDPKVEITDFTYTPASPIRINDKLTFSASLNKSIDSSVARVVAEIGSEAVPLAGYSEVSIVAWLNDYGADGDETAGDGIWTTELKWSPDFGAQQDAPVSGHLQWADGYRTDPIAFEPLTVLPAEDDAS